MTIPVRDDVASGGSNTLTAPTIVAGDFLVIQLWFIGGGSAVTVSGYTPTPESPITDGGNNYHWVFYKTPAVSGDIGAAVTVSAGADTVTGSVFTSFNGSNATFGDHNSSFQLSPSGSTWLTSGVTAVSAAATHFVSTVAQDPVAAGSSGLTLIAATTNGQPYKASEFVKTDMGSGATGVLTGACLSGGLEYSTLEFVIEPATISGFGLHVAGIHYVTA